MKNLFRLLTIVCLVSFMASAPAFAVNGNQVRGVGAYGEGMAGAVTAAPFDTSTLITNPAGITAIGARMDMNFAMFKPERSVDFTAVGGTKTSGGTDSYLIPGIGVSGPVDGYDGWYAGLGIFIIAGMGADFGPMNAGAYGTARLFSKMQFWKIAPTVAKKINDKLSIGFSLNVDYQDIELQQQFGSTATGYGGMDATTSEGAMGTGFTVGLLYDFSKKLSFGLNYSSTQQMDDMKYRLLEGDLNFIDATGTGLRNFDGTYALGLDFPSQWALGVAFRPTSKWTITADYKMIMFSESYNDPAITGDFQSVALGVASGTVVASSYTLNFGWEDISIWAIGLQYQINDRFWVRGGYNHSDLVLGEDDAFMNTALPAVAEDSISLGGTANFGDHWQMNLSYLALTEKNELTSNAGDGTVIALGGSSLQFGLTYRF